jgi:hypothetical protein
MTSLLCSVSRLSQRQQLKGEMSPRSSAKLLLPSASLLLSQNRSLEP